MTIHLSRLEPSQSIPEKVEILADHLDIQFFYDEEGELCESHTATFEGAWNQIDELRQRVTALEEELVAIRKDS